MPAHFLNEVARHASARVDGRQDKQGFEQERKLVPIGHEPGHPRQGGKNPGHPHGQRHRASGPARDVYFDQLREGVNVLNGEPHGRQRFGRKTRVDREIIARDEQGRRDQRHHPDEAFQQHGAIAHHGLGFAGNHLRRGAR